MSSQKLLLNFSDLRNLSSEEILESIPSKTAVEVTLRSIESCEVSQDEVYKIWSTSLFKSYGSEGITTNDLTVLFDSFSDAVKDLLKECGDVKNDEETKKLCEFLKYSLELFTWIRETASEFETDKITLFLCFGLFSTHNYLMLLSKQASKIGARNLIEKSLDIHTVILSVLGENPKTFTFENKETSLANLISGLTSIGEITPKLDIKAAVETWKCITKLASQNATLVQNDDNWLYKPMSFLIKEVGRNVQTVYSQDSLSEQIQHIEKYLKVTNFYLRLLNKLSNDFRHVAFAICEEFIGTLAVVLNAPVYIVNNKAIKKLILDYVEKDLKELMPYAYRNNVYFENLLSEHTANLHSTEAIPEIVYHSVEAIIRNDEPKYLTEQVLNTLLSYISRNFMNGSKATYNRFVQILSCLQVRFNNEKVRQKLILSILHDNTTEALAAIDVLCVVFMLSDKSTRLSTIKFWIDINERFVTFSNAKPALHTELILKNLVAILSSQEKHEICENFKQRFFTYSRLLLTIGKELIPSNETKQAIRRQLQIKLIRYIKESRSVQMTPEIYYEIVKILKQFKSFDFPPNDKDFVEMLFQTLEIAIENKKFFLMVESILDVLAPRINYLDDHKTQRILIILRKNINYFDELSTILSIIEFLRNISKISRFEKKSKEILEILENDEKLKYFECFKEQCTKIEINAGNYDKLWKELIRNRSKKENKLSHICGRNVTIPSKDNDFDVVIEALEDNSNKLLRLTNNKQLNASNLERIEKIVLNLKSISQIRL